MFYRTNIQQLLDNNDKRIRFYHLLLERDAEEIPHYELPEGYSFCIFSDGDRDEWIQIEKSAGEFETYEQGVEAWNHYYKGREEILFDRMFFVINDRGEKIATASAYFDVEGYDKESGWLHWVAVKREEQGKGISKPLISHTLEKLCNLGYKKLVVSTQTTTWLACKIYLDFGFKPLLAGNEISIRGWNIIKTITNHPALSEFEQTEDVFIH